jgi:hypothetical protein
VTDNLVYVKQILGNYAAFSRCLNPAPAEATVSQKPGDAPGLHGVICGTGPDTALSPVNALRLIILFFQKGITFYCPCERDLCKNKSAKRQQSQWPCINDRL